MLNSIFEERYERGISLVKKESDIFSMGIYCDGATIKKSPLFNFLGCGAHESAVVLEIIDCSHHMVEGGKKDGNFIACICEKHIRVMETRTKEGVSLEGSRHCHL
jgi:hypothetical protein